MGVKLKVVSPDLFSHFMFFLTFYAISNIFLNIRGGGGKKEKCFFLENQFFLIMLSLRFRLFQKTHFSGGGGGG